MAGKTKNFAGFARLRGNTPGPKKPLPPFPDFPGQGILDLSSQLEFQGQRGLAPTLFDDLLPLVAPLSSVSYGEESLQAWKRRAAEDFKRQSSATVQIHPSKARPPEWGESELLPGQVLFTPATDGPWVEVTRPELDPGPEQRLGLEIITPDPEHKGSEEKDFGLYGVAYWAYDPLSAKWLIINRWGDDNIPFQTLNSHSALYQHRHQAEKRLAEIAEDLAQRPTGDPSLILRIPSLSERIKVLNNKQQLLNFVARLPEDHALKTINQIDD